MLENIYINKNEVREYPSSHCAFNKHDKRCRTIQTKRKHGESKSTPEKSVDSPTAPGDTESRLKHSFLSENPSTKGSETP